eukprot:TRINITY_DN80931_c0_g1_i1.p1 TRINITY_DN80931_c0_g1~~TRINITY_DN80931_c0_g1_i1.p1  ORF type:complete len:170 (+),score=22.37 TRINITY_DN80931_c0_g1_i1:131-640(+)
MMAKSTGPIPKVVGYRKTFLDKAMDDQMIGSNSGHYKPGPGHHRTSRQMPLWDSGDKSSGNLNTGRMQDSYSCSWIHTSHTSLKTSQHGQTHLSEGEDIDAARTIWPKVASFSITKSQNLRNLTSLKQAKATRLPTSFLAPGPGAYETAVTMFKGPDEMKRRRSMSSTR